MTVPNVTGLKVCIAIDWTCSPALFTVVIYHFCMKEKNMLWTIFVILLVLWLLGMVTGATLNGFIHLLLVIAIVVVLLRVIQGRQVV